MYYLPILDTIVEELFTTGDVADHTVMLRCKSVIIVVVDVCVLKIHHQSLVKKETSIFNVSIHPENQYLNRKNLNMPFNMSSSDSPQYIRRILYKCAFRNLVIIILSLLWFVRTRWVISLLPLWIRLLILLRLRVS